MVFHAGADAVCNANLSRSGQPGLAFKRGLGMVRTDSFAMTSVNINARAMIIGMIIISRRPGRGRIA